jgi:acyl-CoA synthetase (AMP-forming)/AMP-acid ligase II
MATWPSSLRGPERARPGGELVCPEAEVRVVAAAGAADEDSGYHEDRAHHEDRADGEARVSAPLCGSGQLGELQFRSKHIMKRYFNDTGASKRAFTSDGWFRSGDRGYLSGPNSFVYVCRMGESLRLHGFLVEPREIESFLMAQTGVDGARVVGAPDADGQESAIAFVKLSPGVVIAGDELRSRCREQLAAYKVPVEIVVVDQFPVTSGTNGEKISVIELKSRARRIALRGV